MNGHPTREEDFDLYVLGALEGDEKNAIESHVRSCAQCAQDLAAARGRVALLALAAPAAPPSPVVKERLMKRIREDARGAVPGTVSSDPKESGGFFSRWWNAILVPAVAVLAIASIFLWTQNRRLDQQLASLRADMHSQQEQLQQARQMADLVTARDTISVVLAAQPAMPKGGARVMYNAKMGMLMYDGELASAPPDKSYQLWLVPAQGNPISAGLLNGTGGAMNHLMVKLPEGIVPKAFAVTLEPAGGQPQPTGPKVLVGGVS